MADFGVLEKFRKIISECSLVKKKGFSNHIYTFFPVAQILPMIVLELEEVWTGMNAMDYCRLKLKASIVSKNAASKESLQIAETIKEALDGRVLELENGRKGITKLESSIVDLPTVNKPRKVQQYYHILLRA